MSDFGRGFGLEGGWAGGFGLTAGEEVTEVKAEAAAGSTCGSQTSYWPIGEGSAMRTIRALG